ncbi:uncharacterized protein T551_03269 [Pneumocystis jirovecii RU7]|uniref:SUN-like protein 1 n=1 Tax=Pneumocystis jirovecii (strain RU7) TaxID=1408657 RepID=A0A0W4ZEK5_PNEJ7|nr:uncharacterized protein T551_03269 [Pneumocystis jirovecii RU7]KTW26807.1 hypothetical protein T551_03269 [Pneumocystis jirovecii RU7]
MIEIIEIFFFWLFFFQIFQSYAQNLSDTEWFYQLQCRNTAFVFNTYCFSLEDDILERYPFANNGEFNGKFKKEFENLVESLFLSFDDWKKHSVFDTLNRSEVNDFNNTEDNSKYYINESFFHDFKKMDQVYTDNDLRDNQKDKIHIETNSSSGNFLYNLFNHSGRSKILPKERFNYASADCAASVLKANAEAKGVAFILSSNKDRYMLNKCSANNKFVIIELCNDILIDTIVLGNLEFFSSSFKDFRISVSDRYPVKRSLWKELGIFTAMNIKDIQTFTITNPLIWAKYLRIDFLTHYGDEFYCPVTLLRVYGTTMIEEFKYDENEFEENNQSGTESSFKEYSFGKQKTNYPNNKISEISSSPFQYFVGTPIVIDYAVKTLNNNINHNMASYPLCFISTLKKSLNNYDYQISALFLKDLVCSALNNHSNQDLNLVSEKMNSSFVSLVSNVSTELPTKSTLVQGIGTQITQSIKQQSSPSNTENVGMQKNIYKNISKRLSFLEINTTLYLQYIEQQSKILRSIFVKMEKEHDDKIDFIIRTLNSTLFSRLDIFKHQYEELWQIITTEIEYQRTRLKNDINIVTFKMEYLSNEILIQRWVIIFQFLVLFTILVFFVIKQFA